MRSFEGLKNQQAIKQEMTDFRKSDIMPKYRQIVSWLYRNPDLCCKSAWIEKRFSVTMRQVQHIVRHARRCGHPLLSGSNGYWMEKDPARMIDCANSLRSRALDILETVHFMGKAATRRQHWSFFSREVRQMELNL